MAAQLPKNKVKSVCARVAENNERQEAVEQQQQQEQQQEQENKQSKRREDRTSILPGIPVICSWIEFVCWFEIQFAFSITMKNFPCSHLLSQLKSKEVIYSNIQGHNKKAKKLKDSQPKQPMKNKFAEKHTDLLDQISSVHLTYFPR